MKPARTLGVVTSMLITVGMTVAVAPAASATADGCGDLSNGQLCIRGPIGKKGTFTTSYVRNKSGEVTVELGYQRKNSDITALPGWFGEKKTRNGRASLSGTVDTDPKECIRGVMLHNSETYVTKWSCD